MLGGSNKDDSKDIDHAKSAAGHENNGGGSGDDHDNSALRFE
jgi:hypothetical protein